MKMTPTKNNPRYANGNLRRKHRARLRAMGCECGICLTLASRGWQRASQAAIKGGHAEHIHASCDCEYAVRFDGRTSVAGYDPEAYLAQYNAAGGDINRMRRVNYAKNKERINAQKRAAYEARKTREDQ